jgi:translocator protein
MKFSKITIRSSRTPGRFNEITVSDALRLMVSLFIPLYAGLFGGLATASSVSVWYPTLIKPFFNPPGWIFGPVWILLYILMGLSLFIIWENGLDKETSRIAIVIFACQLILNIFWSFAFFGFMAPALGLVVILMLLAGIALMIYSFYHISKFAAFLNVPYFLWVLFATVLNIAIVVLN